MSYIDYVDVLIVGSGPAGMSTALHLVQADQSWAERILVIDKAVHPREKLCGGGVTRPGEAILTRLGLSIETPQVPVHEMRLIYENEAQIFREARPLFRVVRRDEFDHWLMCCGRERGVMVREGEVVQEIQPYQDYVEIITERGAIHAKTVVAADGSRSFVRQKLKWHDAAHMSRLLEVLTPESEKTHTAFEQGVAIFDFSGIRAGLQGYYWDFPSLIKGQPFMNRGVFDSRARPERPRVGLKQTLQSALADRGRNLADYELKGHPIHWFDRQGRFARPRIILVGDAAGVDPLVGEGISFALGYGPVAAGAIIDAFAQQDFSFADYCQRILRDPLLSELPVRARLARVLYSLKYPWQVRMLWKLSGLLVSTLNRLAPRSVPFVRPRLVKLSK